MKLDSIFISLCGGILFLSACTYQFNSNAAQYSHKLGDKPYKVYDKSNWNGKYEGLLPCKDCIGIKTELRLTPDFRYSLRETYLGHTAHTKVYHGTFKFNDIDPNVIVLDATANQRQYTLDKDMIEARQADGSEITSVLKPHYQMQKISN